MEEGEGVIAVREIEERGRAVVASKALKAGQIVLRDSPLLLYSALAFVHHHHLHQTNSYCSHCFRALQPCSSSSSTVACTSCSSLFCNPNCLSIALSTSHTPWSCQSLIRLHRHYESHQQPEPEPEERQVQSRFLVAAYNLSMVSPSSFQSLLSLQGGGGECPDNAASLSLHSIISSLFPPPLPQSFSLELTSLLLVKDKLNAFGLMEPFTTGKVGERSVRAYGIYPRASFFNHDCLPNACRFDYLDAPAPPSNSHYTCDIIIRLIHDVPMGREICLSYFPVNLNYSQRQRRLQDDYGFTCDCDRCKVEANWSDGDDYEDVDVGGDDDIDNNHDEDIADMDEDSEVHMVGSDTADADFPHAYFFLRYLCDRNNCWGTLAPLPPSGIVTSSMLECNVCGNLKNCDEVMVEGLGQ